MILDDNLRETLTQSRCILMYRYRHPTWEQRDSWLPGPPESKRRILGLPDDTVCIAKVIQRYIQIEDDIGQIIKQGFGLSRTLLGKRQRELAMTDFHSVS